MTKFIYDRSFMKVMVKTSDGKQMYQLCGDKNVPLIFIDEIEGAIYKLCLDTPYNHFYSKEKIDNGT